MSRDLMSRAEEGFAQTYAEARGKFLAAVEAAGLDVQSHPHPMLGRDGEPLAMDVVRDGPADAPAVLVLSSACHGVEGSRCCRTPTCAKPRTPAASRCCTSTASTPTASRGGGARRTRTST